MFLMEQEYTKIDLIFNDKDRTSDPRIPKIISFFKAEMKITGEYIIILTNIKDDDFGVNSRTTGKIFPLDQIKEYITYLD